MQTVELIVTEVGNFPMPAAIRPLWRKARKRRDGRVDERYSDGKELARWEREFIRVKREAWLNERLDHQIFVDAKLSGRLGAPL